MAFWYTIIFTITLLIFLAVFVTIIILFLFWLRLRKIEKNIPVELNKTGGNNGKGNNRQGANREFEPTGGDNLNQGTIEERFRIPIPSTEDSGREERSPKEDWPVFD